MSEFSAEARLWELERGALAARALGVAADLGVADALADGPRPVAEVADELGAEADTLHRILRALASDGVFAEHAPGVFGNTEASSLLRSDHPDRWRDFAHLFGGVFHRVAVCLDPTLRDAGSPKTLGADFWSWLRDHPDERAAFDRAMSGGKERTAAALAELDWRGDETVVDVGGGNGAALAELLRRRRGLRGIVFDLPETDRDETTFGDKLEFVAGSFFERVPRGDAYVLSAILHDWDDERAAAILRTVRAAAPDDARLLVIESVLAPGNDPHGSKWLDLLMLTLLGGRERTEPEWRALLEGAGFAVERIEDGLIQARCR